MRLHADDELARALVEATTAERIGRVGVSSGTSGTFEAARSARNTCLSAFDTLLGVYTGNAVNALTLVANNDDISTNCVRSRLTFTPVAGASYYIAVDGKNGANGNLTLRWAQASVALLGSGWHSIGLLGSWL